MQIINDNVECIGCGVCENVCPQKAVTMKYDDNGFLFPFVDELNCINCGKCAQLCPQNMLGVFKLRHNEKPKSYACRHKIPEKRYTSTSGGAFHAIAEHIICEKKGLVFGAHLDLNCRIVEHICISNLQELELIKGSKYIQSEMGKSYLAVRNALKEGRWVLFSGCPCQVYALYAFLGRDYECLITSEVVCHGVGSTKIFQKYLNEMEQSADCTISTYEFRNKSRGWINKSVSIGFDDGRKVVIPSNKDPYMRCYYQRAIYRQSCYSCLYARMPRYADYTLGDYFGIPINVFGREGDNGGVSLLLINSKKAESLFLEFCDNFVYTERELREAVETNSNLVAPSKKPDYYDALLRSTLSITESAKKYCTRNKKTELKAKLKELLIRNNLFVGR